MGESRLSAEGVALRRCWDRHDSRTLDTYLTSDVEDPRINVQSILTRALVSDSLWPGKFEDLIHEEFCFGFALTWVLERLRDGIPRKRLFDEIRHGRSALCPRFVLETFERLTKDTSSYPDYLSAALDIDEEETAAGLGESVLDIFRPIWRHRLTGIHPSEISIVEPACGSANDFRCLHSFGFSPYLRYTGFDIAPKNIQNAIDRFPDIDFRIGDVLASDLEDDSFEFCFVHDLFEHLSPAALTKAIEEVLRITRRQVWLHFFNVADVPEHRFERRGDYHWNLLSLRELVNTVGARARDVEVVRITDLAQIKFGFTGYYNQGACTLIATT